MLMSRYLYVPDNDGHVALWEKRMMVGNGKRNHGVAKSVLRELNQMKLIHTMEKSHEAG